VKEFRTVAKNYRLEYNKIHGLVEFKEGRARTSTHLGSYRMYDIAALGLGVHLVLIDKGTFFLNLYIDYK